MMGEDMDEPFYVARATIDKVAGVHRRARLESGHTVDFGVHGAIKRLYALEDQPNLPLPVDYIVAATGG
jgi:hypothetical protein